MRRTPRKKVKILTAAIARISRTVRTVRVSPNKKTMQASPAVRMKKRKQTVRMKDRKQTIRMIPAGKSRAAAETERPGTGRKLVPPG